jgi:hypothetical protein
MNAVRGAGEFSADMQRILTPPATKAKSGGGFARPRQFFQPPRPEFAARAEAAADKRRPCA